MATFVEIRRELAYALGMGSNVAGLSADKQDRLKWFIQGGLRQFYYPPILPGQNRSHQWSFLRPVGSLDTVANQDTYEMASTFGELEGPVTIHDQNGMSARGQVDIVGEGYVRRLKQAGDRTGRPAMVALVHTTVTVDQLGAPVPQKKQLVFFPTPDAVYPVQYRFQVIWTDPDESSPYLYGADQHSETILAACLAYAEERLEAARGINYAYFIERLAASISVDMGQGGEFLGYNGDGSDGGCRVARPRGDYITVRGVLPT